MELAERKQIKKPARSHAGSRMVERIMIAAGAVLLLLFLHVLWIWVPRSGVRYTLTLLCGGICLLAAAWCVWQRRQICGFAEDLCRTLDELMEGHEPGGYEPYEDTLTARVQGKFLQYYDLMSEERRRSMQEKQTIQELVSDISHQVKTPIANLSMFIGILQKHQLNAEKQSEFLETMSRQIDKLDFLMQSLIKMSRLETGTFAMHVKETSLYDTIAQALNGVLARAEAKNISLSVECDENVMVRHDAKWTAEAFGNLLDNSVKYTPEGGSIHIRVRPWQFYTRVDITDTGIGIPEEHFHDVFKRFYRGEDAAGLEGVGLGLYLAQGIMTRQRGYISVKSKLNEGSTFSVYLLNQYTGTM